MQKQRRFSSIWALRIGIDARFNLELADASSVNPIKADLCQIGKRKPASLWHPLGVIYSVPVSFSQEFALGQTINIAARVQSLADSRAIFTTKSVVENSQVSKMLEASKLKLTEQAAALRGVADRMTVYQIP